MHQAFPEDGSHGGAGRLGAVYVRAGAAEQDRVHPHGGGCTDQGPHIAGVLHILQQQRTGKTGLRLRLRHAQGEEWAGTVLHGRGVIEKLRRGHILPDLLKPGQVLRPLFPEDLCDRGALVQRLCQQLSPIADILPFRAAQSGIIGQHPEPGNDPVLP